MSAKSKLSAPGLIVSDDLGDYMTAIHETAYPRIRSGITEKELVEIYTPDKEEIEFVYKNARSDSSRLGLLVLLKIFQRLGYFPAFTDIPYQIIEYIGIVAGFQSIKSNIGKYSKMKSRTIHTSLIRDFLKIKPFTKGGEECMMKAMSKAAQVMDNPADIINAAIEELVLERYELPAFSKFKRLAYKARNTVNNTIYLQIYEQIDDNYKESLRALLTREENEFTSPWHKLKQDPGRPTIREVRNFIIYLKWLQSIAKDNIDFDNVPESKFKRFVEEAKTLNVAQINEIYEQKRFSLAVSLIHAQKIQAYDDLAEMFIRRVKILHNTADKALQEYKASHQQIAEQLIETLGKIAENWGSTKDKEYRVSSIDKIFAGNEEDYQKKCEAYLAYAKNNYFLFLPQFYKHQRAIFFNLLEILKPKSASSDKTLELAINFLLTNRYSRAVEISVTKEITLNDGETETVSALNLSWIPDKWWKLVTNTHQRGMFVRNVNRVYFELCLFSCISKQLRTEDLFVENADKYNDTKKQLVTQEEYEAEIDSFCYQKGYSSKSEKFISHLSSRLKDTIIVTDKSFPENESVKIINGEPVIRKARKKPDPPGLIVIEKLISERLPDLNILDVLSDTEYWLNWTLKFGPVSGFADKLDKPIERYITTTFCYGCGLGPSQTARSLDGLDRKQVAYINQKHITEDKLLKANFNIINEYNKFDLPRFWGSGKNASVDGTKWDIYEKNLLSEYHIRYGGWGGIGYYHVSDNYIALFSNFISCGVWEAIYILDGLLENRSDIKPDTVHGDTQAQSLVVFALAYLLGIKLMPRIRNLKDLKFYLPSKDFKIKHIGEIFSEVIDWELIRTHLPDMLRVALSISKGKIRCSKILRKLGTSGKSKLYFAFRELGSVIRTIFLLNFIGDESLRKMINAATTISEAWNGFIKWVGFGGNGVITENNREEQRKFIRYNHLVGNLIIFHNVASMTNIIQELVNEGHDITPEILSCLSPYKTAHINRFGKYHFVDREPEPVIKSLQFK